MPRADFDDVSDYIEREIADRTPSGNYYGMPFAWLIHGSENDIQYDLHQMGVNISDKALQYCIEQNDTYIENSGISYRDALYLLEECNERIKDERRERRRKKQEDIDAYELAKKMREKLEEQRLADKKSAFAGTRLDPDFHFYGQYGDTEDATRERYVNQEAVVDGRTPSGRLATQQAIDGYIGDKRIAQVKVVKGRTPSGSLADQPKAKGFLSKRREAKFNGLDEPEWILAKMGLELSGASTPRPLNSRIPAPKMPGQGAKRRKRR